MSFIYPSDIKFECGKCTLCCGNTEIKIRHIIMLKKEAEEISKQTKMDITDFCVEIINNHPYQFEMKKLDTDKCFFLKQGLCSIYDFRPLICRCYPFELKFDEDQQKHVFIATVECASLNSGNKRLTQAYFQRLFWLAEEKFL